MNPVNFPEANVIIAKDQPPYKPLPALYCGDDMGTMVTCWQLGEDEIEELKRTRLLWVTILTFKQLIQPLCLSPEKPILDNGSVQIGQTTELNPNLQRIAALERALADCLSNYREDGKESFVSAERQEAWLAVLKGEL